MDIFNKGFNSLHGAQKVIDSASDEFNGVMAKAGDLLRPVSEAGKAIVGKASETGGAALESVSDIASGITDGVKSAVDSAKEKEPDEYDEAVIEYNLAFTDMEAVGNALFQTRIRSADLLDNITRLVGSIANSPKSFATDVEEMNVSKRQFRAAESFAREKLDSARKSAASAGAGVAAGMAIASMAPTAAIWVATTFGTASTGAAIATLSGAAATNAALAWLGGGALATGGAGMAGGTALLAMAGPIGWGFAGATLLTSIVLFAKRKHDVSEEKHKELLSIKGNTAALRRTSEMINELEEGTEGLRSQLSEEFISLCRMYGSDYLSLSQDEKLSLGAFVNKAKSLSRILGETIDVGRAE